MVNGPISAMFAIWLLGAAFWLSLAIPTARLGNRLYGHPKWIAYVAWCPFTVWAVLAAINPYLVSYPTLKMLQYIGFLPWIPGAVSEYDCFS